MRVESFGCMPDSDNVDALYSPVHVFSRRLFVYKTDIYINLSHQNPFDEKEEFN